MSAVAALSGKRYSVRTDEDDRCVLIDWLAPHAQRGTAPRTMGSAWHGTPEADALYAQADALNTEHGPVTG